MYTLKRGMGVEGQGEGKNLRHTPAECGAQLKARSHDSEIMTSAQIKSRMHQGPRCPGALDLSFLEHILWTVAVTDRRTWPQLGSQWQCSTQGAVQSRHQSCHLLKYHGSLLYADHCASILLNINSDVVSWALFSPFDTNPGETDLPKVQLGFELGILSPNLLFLTESTALVPCHREARCQPLLTVSQ